MISGKRVLAVVPARGGSKGIPLKNLRTVRGLSLVEHVGRCASAVSLIDFSVVSTDHEGIAEAAERAGLSAPFRRPASLSGDRIGDIDVLVHALEETERLSGTRFDIVLMLQPTSPLREPEHVIGSLKMLDEGGWDAVWTVSETDSKAHPLKQLTIDDSKLGLWDAAGAGIIARQQLKPVYHRNGLAYAFTRACLLDQRTIMGARTGALVTDGHFVSIDTEWDLRLVDFILAQRAGRANS